MSLGETALGLGARFYFGSVYPLLNYSSLLPVSYTYNSIGYFSNANMNYYQYITNNLQGNLGISDYSSRDFPYILFGDPSLILQNYSSYKSPNMYVNSKEMFLNFSNININYGFINLDNLVHEHDIDKIYKKNNGFIFEKDNFFQISENDKEKLVNYHKFFNYFKRIFSPEEYLFSVVSNNTIFNIALKDKWKAYKISYIKNRFYLTLDMDTPLFYDIENPDFLENFNSWFDKNASIFANVFIDDKPILSKEIILKIDKNTDNKFLYFDLTWEDFLDMIKNGVLDNPYRIVISEQKYKLK
jgi:hypothetical protein